MLKIFSAAALVAITSVALAQSTPSTTTSDTPSVAPSTTPSVTPSQTPSVTPSQAPTVTQTPISPPSAVGGLGKCENLIGTEKDKCLQEERAGGTGSTAPGSTTSGTSTQPTAPIGSPTGTVR